MRPERAAYFSVRMTRPMSGAPQPGDDVAAGGGRRCIGLWGLRGEGEEDEAACYRNALVHQPAHMRADPAPLALAGEAAAVASPGAAPPPSPPLPGEAEQIPFNDGSGVSIQRSGDGVGYEYTYYDRSDDGSASSATAAPSSDHPTSPAAAAKEKPAVQWTLADESFNERTVGW